MKKIYILLTGIILLIACNNVEDYKSLNKKYYYIDQDFKLVEKKENIVFDTDNNRTYRLRIWKLEKPETNGLGYWRGEIVSRMLLEDGDMCEFHRNESSWCANNIIPDLERLAKKNCLCGHTKFTYLREATADDEKSQEIYVNDQES